VKRPCRHGVPRLPSELSCSDTRGLGSRGAFRDTVRHDKPEPLARRPWPLGASHFLRDLAFLLLFLVPIALCTAAVFRRAVAMDLAGFGSSTEGAFPPSDMTSSRRCSPDGKRKKKKAICRCASNETRAASKGDMNQNIIIFFPNDTVLWPLSMKSVPTEYGSKALCRIDWCDEPPLGRARALGMRWARTL
jgi:hypothetical protein